MLQAEEDGRGAVAFGTVLDHFAESGELASLVDTLPHICRDPIALEASQERFTVILDKYQEQPHLLDPYLESLIGKLFDLALQEDAPPPLIHQAFKYLYLVSKVRGHKVVVRWFSHEVADLEPVLRMLLAQDCRDHETWETRYILLLWLSIIVMIPFDLTRMDGTLRVGQATTIDRIVELGKRYLHMTDKTRDAAAKLLAKFLSRVDVRREKTAEFLDWAFTALRTADMKTMAGMTVLSGVLSTLSSLFKHAKREDVVPYAGTVLRALSSISLTSSDNTLLRKLNIKLAQRLGMTFLKARVAAWRYQRGGRSLEETLAVSNSAEGSTGSVKDGDIEEEEGYDVPEELEEVLGLLFGGLRDKDTVVRWSAAKGVGRVTGRLPRELGNEVVLSLLECFSFQDNDTAWHGGCLALAELGRRGLLLPQRLNDVVPVVLKALEYDERRGSYSVGAHVRDAACYVCWSFARAYEPEELNPYVTAIASGLVIATVFDREVNCRKAASAAFQENVGRQGTFPHGIDILTTADYFAVGSRTNSYLNLSVFVGQYSEYTRPLIDHLWQHKLGHWDSSLRELSAQALHNLTALDPVYIRNQVLPALLPLVTIPDPSLRHGALHAVAEIAHALYKHSISSSPPSIPDTSTECFGGDILTALSELVPKLQLAKVFKGAIGEMMRPAALKFIEKMCICELPVQSTSVIESWQAVVDDNLPHTEESIREAAVSALLVLSTQRYCTDQETIRATQDKIITRYVSELDNQLHFARMGFALALGSLPKPLLQGKLSQVMAKLIESVNTVHGIESKFTEARRDAVKALSRICLTVGVSSSGSCEQSVCSDNLGSLYQALFAATEDYTTDSRGDIGAVVREAGICGIGELSLLVAMADPDLLPPKLIKEAVCHLVQQACEKIDRTRDLACTTLMSLIHHKPVVPHISHHQQLLDIFRRADMLVTSLSSDGQVVVILCDLFVTGDVIIYINWSAPQSSFPLTVQLLGLNDYRYHTLLGMLVSVGGLTESTVRQSSSSLLSYLKNISGELNTLNPFSDTILMILTDYHKDSRVILPLLKTLDLLLSNAVFDVYSSVDDHCFPSTLITLIKKEITKSRDAKKILASINVFCGLLPFSCVKKIALNQLMLLLCHPFPKVRKTTADQFYITLITFDDIIDVQVSDEVVAVLSDTAWDGAVESIREQRNRLCHLLALPIPKLKAKVNGASKPKSAVVDDLSYQDLVDRAGY